MRRIAAILILVLLAAGPLRAADAALDAERDAAAGRLAAAMELPALLTGMRLAALAHLRAGREPDLAEMERSAPARARYHRDFLARLDAAIEAAHEGLPARITAGISARLTADESDSVSELLGTDYGRKIRRVIHGVMAGRAERELWSPVERHAFRSFLTTSIGKRLDAAFQVANGLALDATKDAIAASTARREDELLREWFLGR